MFTRRKILLAILETSGGELNNTDMEKLLFVYCNEYKKNHFDFFPYKFGCFSFLSYQDKRVLTQQGFLADSDNFKLKKRQNYLNIVEGDERKNIEEFAKRRKNLRGKNLIRYVYVNYPYFAIRSEIKEEILQSNELDAVKSSMNSDTSICLMTIGYEGLTIDSYINKLIQNNVALVVDVRRNPLSMKYGFSKTRFRNYLERAGIRYEHIPALGIESSQRKNLETEKDYKALFKKYKSQSLPKCHEELDRIENLVMIHRRVALTCFEAEAHSCHRHKIIEYLQSDRNWSIQIKHI
ncbi:MAG: DUF488 domain-containing protein [Bacteroidota bacterium]|nr:DUF488 domain-containing protein [Bacteroidota bacterium]